MQIKVHGAVAVALTGLSAFGAIRSVTPQTWGANPKCWQMKRHFEKMEAVTNGGAKVVFVGDSITHFGEMDPSWKRYFAEGETRALCLGTAGDRTEHVLWRITEGGELDGYEAKVVFLMIGTNNAGCFPFEKEPPSDTILGIREILRVIRQKQPGADIVLLAIFPRGIEPSDPCRLRNDVVNREIRKFTLFDRKMHWVDLTDRFLFDDGTLSLDLFPDKLHPVTPAYEIWYAAIRPYIEYAFKGGTAPIGDTPARPLKTMYRGNRPGESYPVTPIPGHVDWIGGKDWWTDRLLANRNRIVAETNAFDLVLLGDANTPVGVTNATNVLDLRYDGDRTENILWRATNGELEGFKAKEVVLVAGSNNGGGKPEDTAAAVRQLLDVVRAKHPEAKVRLMPVVPRTPRAKNWAEAVNAKLVSNADGDKIIWGGAEK